MGSKYSPINSLGFFLVRLNNSVISPDCSCSLLYKAGVTDKTTPVPTFTTLLAWCQLSVHVTPLGHTRRKLVCAPEVLE